MDTLPPLRQQRDTAFRLSDGGVYWLGAHYLGRKHRRSIKRLMRTHYGIDPQSGKRALSITDSNRKRVFFWNKPPRRQSVFSPAVSAKDSQPLPLTSWAEGRSFERRQALFSETNGRCQSCGQAQAKLIV